MTPKTLVRRWLAAFNAGDPDAMAVLYRDDAVYHPVAGEPVVAGRDAIRDSYAADFAAAPVECLPDNLFEEGEWAVLEWRVADGGRGASFFHIIDGRIALQRGYWDRARFESVLK